MDSVNDTAARHPNRFLADLTQAMRSTAENARQATMDQCKTDAKTYVEQLHARSEQEGVQLRKAAESDVTSIRDWSKAEVERIRVETEERISRRRELLDQELQEYSSGVELEAERVQQRVSSFEEEVAQFFEQLLQEADPTVFASMAAQMPDPPSFSEADRGSPAPALKARREQIMRAPVAEPQAPAAGGTDGTGPSPEAEREPEREPEPEAAGESAEEAASARGRGRAPAPAAGGGRESTQVVVVGLVSVASIANFKRQLGRLPGVKNVGVSSGPDGEFIFTVGHSAETSLTSLVPTLPNFQARVVSEREGVLNVSAHDPEAEG
jgi:hypothetical protein